MAIFLDQPFAEVRVGAWRLSNNTWGVGNLQNGTDYWQTIQYTPGTINGTRFAWEQRENWQGNVRAFPQVIYGTKPWDKGRMSDVTMRLDQMQNLDMTVDLRVERYSGVGNVALDLWLTDKAGGGPATVTTEVMLWLDDDNMSPSGTKVGRMNVQGIGADIYVHENLQNDSASGISWRYIAVKLDVEYLIGTIDIDGFLRQLVSLGWLSADDWISGMELGAEVVSGNGALNINNLSAHAAHYDVTAGADNLTGSQGADLINARGGNDSIAGGAGRDTLLGDGGQDRLDGGGGNDLLQGGAGNDRLLGMFGADTLLGGGGADVLAGGAGADRFVFATGDSLPARMDRITDFAGSAGDRIDLQQMDADTLLEGDQAFTLVDAFTGAAGELRIQSQANGFVLIGNTDSDAAAEFRLLVKGDLMPDYIFF
ncbi:MAG: hypothetical protein A2092_09755 [Rhodobacteraceae bacterium GWE1_64_9]|nr:MAG: hypothetical protein A2092_09755 [Rhodobacteraceae bacterium GWE1_64_9]HBU14037.1 hypothetical protein [Gemmobacter sp.]